MRPIRILCLALTVVLSSSSLPVGAGDAGQAARIIVGFPAGGTTDLVARMLAERLHAESGNRVIVENKPGAAGRVAAIAVRNASPDELNILVTPAVVPVLAPLVFRNIGYDPAKDFAPVAQVATFQFGLAVAADHPARTLQEFIEWMRIHPAQANIGTLGAGSAGHFLADALGRASGISIVHVPYNGIAPLTVDLLGGQLGSGLDVLSNLIELRRAGKIRILATSGAQRSTLLPAIPTFAEQGFPGIVGTGWLAAFVPAGTPAPVVARLSKAIVDAVQFPQNAATLRSAGLEPTGTSPEELAAIIAADIAHWRPLIRASGFSPE